MIQISKEESFIGIYSIHTGGLIEFTFFASLQNGEKIHTVKCNYDGKSYQFIMLPSSEKGNYVISGKENLPDFIIDLEEDLSESIFNQYQPSQAK
jgi:hypothetical protein